MSSSNFIGTKSENHQNAIPLGNQSELLEAYAGHIKDAEKANGRWAMIGFIALLGAYTSTGQIIPGIY